jgi:hypothetical protein
LARLFDDPDDFDRQYGNRLLKLLIGDGSVSRGVGGPVVDWQVVNKTIADRLNGYEQAKSKEDREQIFSQLGRHLEKRESLICRFNTRHDH